MDPRNIARIVAGIDHCVLVFGQHAGTLTPHEERHLQTLATVRLELLDQLASERFERGIGPGIAEQAPHGLS